MNKKFEWAQLPTLQSKEILSELMEASQDPLAKMIIAETGLGKTNAITLFKQKNPNNTFVVTLGESYSRNDMLDEISALTNVKRYVGKNSKHLRIRAISKRFAEIANDNPVLILDEFENARIPVLKSMKELYDAIGSKCSIVLIGTDQLITQFNKKSINQSIPQLRRRFKAGTRHITPIKKARDFKPFFDKYIPNESAVQDLLLMLCDNYGELHDYLYPVLNNCSKKAIKISAEVFKNYHKIKM
jgi:DNA transposition AAA+ family ATPase